MRTDSLEDVSATALRTSALDLGDGEFRNRYALEPFSSYPTRPVKTSRPFDLEAAANNPTGDSNRAPVSPTPRPSSEGVPPNHGYVWDGKDLMSLALIGGGAKCAGSRGFRMLDGLGDSETPRALLQFEVGRIDGP